MPLYVCFPLEWSFPLSNMYVNIVLANKYAVLLLYQNSDYNRFPFYLGLFLFEPVKDQDNDLTDNNGEHLKMQPYGRFFNLKCAYFCSQVVIEFSLHHSILSPYTRSQAVNKEEISFSGDKERFPTVQFCRLPFLQLTQSLRYRVAYYLLLFPARMKLIRRNEPVSFCTFDF